MTLVHDEQLTIYFDEWTRRFREDTDLKGKEDPQMCRRVRSDPFFKTQLAPSGPRFCHCTFKFSIASDLSHRALVASRVIRGLSCIHLGSNKRTVVDSKRKTGYSWIKYATTAPMKFGIYS